MFNGARKRLDRESSGFVSIRDQRRTDTVNSFCIRAAHYSANPRQSSFQFLGFGRWWREEITLGNAGLYGYSLNRQFFYRRGKSVSFQIKPQKRKEHVMILRGNRQLPIMLVFLSIFPIANLPDFEV